MRKANSSFLFFLSFLSAPLRPFGVEVADQQLDVSLHARQRGLDFVAKDVGKLVFSLIELTQSHLVSASLLSPPPQPLALPLVAHPQNRSQQSPTAVAQRRRADTHLQLAAIQGVYEVVRLRPRDHLIHAAHA